MAVQNHTWKESSSNYALVNVVRSASLTDGQITDASLYYANKRVENSTTRKIKKAIFPAAVLTMATVAAAKTPAKLSGKLMSAGKFAGAVLVATQLVNAFAKFSNKTINHSEKTREKTQEHPLLTAVSIVGGMFAVAFAAFPLLKGGKNIIVKNLPEFTKNINKQWGKIAKNIDKSFLGKKTESIKKAYANLPKTNPKLAGVTSFIAKHTQAIVTLGALAAIVGVNSRESVQRKTTALNMQKYMSDARNDARELLHDAVSSIFDDSPLDSKDPKGSEA